MNRQLPTQIYTEMKGKILCCMLMYFKHTIFNEMKDENFKIEKFLYYHKRESNPNTSHSGAQTIQTHSTYMVKTPNPR